MAKFKVMSSVGEGKEFMNGIEFEQDFLSEEIGEEVFVMGGKFTIVQNGTILVLTNPLWVMTIMKQEVPRPAPELLEKLEANKDYEIFFKTKTIQINKTPLVERGVTYKEFFEAIEKEWSHVQKLMPDRFPIKFNNEFNQLVFLDDWSWEGSDFSLLRQGSWGRESADGRSI